MIGKIIIPARIDSKRLPRKALLDIGGEPMIVKTSMNAIEAVGQSNVFVATDSEEIKNCCDKYCINSIMTSNCLTGTDRVIAAASVLGLKSVYNLQGDEPLFPSRIIKKFIESTDKSGKSWFTVGVSPNIIEASFKALIDSLDYKLFKENAPANLNE